MVILAFVKLTSDTAIMAAVSQDQRLDLREWVAHHKAVGAGESSVPENALTPICHIGSVSGGPCNTVDYSVERCLPMQSASDLTLTLVLRQDLHLRHWQRAAAERNSSGSPLQTAAL